MASTRQTFLTYLRDTLFPTLTTGNGYNFTVATNERGIRNVATMPAELFPALFIVNADEARKNSTRVHFQSTMSVNIAGFVRDTNGIPGALQEELDKLIEDVTKVLYADPTQGNRVMWTEVSRVDTDDGDLAQMAGFVMQVDFQYSAVATTT